MIVAVTGLSDERSIRVGHSIASLKRFLLGPLDRSSNSRRILLLEFVVLRAKTVHAAVPAEMLLDVSMGDVALTPLQGDLGKA